MPDHRMFSENIIAFIPAKGGSTRIPGKNIKDFFGHPLIAYTIETAKRTHIFDRIITITDSSETAEIARCYGAEVLDEPKEFAQPLSYDYQWVNWAIAKLEEEECYASAYAILRPTNPFRKPASIVKAWGKFLEANGPDSLRAVRPVKEHPAKMWFKNPEGEFITSYGYPYGFSEHKVPKHEMQTQALPETYIQSAALEIFWEKTPRNFKNITGRYVLYYRFPQYEDFDLNTEDDWILAEELVHRGKVKLPGIGEEECSVCSGKKNKDFSQFLQAVTPL